MDEGVDDLHGGMSGQYTATSIRYTRGMPTIDPASVPYDRIRAVEWEQGRLKLIDHACNAPGKFSHLYLDSLPEVGSGDPGDMVVRGAPAIGVTAAYAVVCWRRGTVIRKVLVAGRRPFSRIDTAWHPPQWRRLGIYQHL